MTAIEGWDNFYVIVGSSAGALIGLQFVVITLIADLPVIRDAAQASGAFTTPSVIHFGIVLLLSAIVSMPWNGIDAVAVIWALMGLGGIAYATIVALRLRAQNVYKPVFEDWLSHVLLPFAAYAALAVAAGLARSHARPALFLVAGSSLLLLFVGIHNAWDTVTYNVFVLRREQQERSQSGKTKE
jgi:hypothetical protein